MVSSDELLVFVKDGLAQRLSRSEIEGALARAGWRPEQISGALARYADVEFPIPVPRPKPHLSAREAFMYLLLFSMLYVSAYQLGSLLFELIDRRFPDPAGNPLVEEYIRLSIRWSVASLIAAFPVFVLMAWLTSRSVQREPNARTSPVRKWLTYLTLFIAASVLIGDVTTLVYNLLGGEITTRFVLKVLTVGVIAGSAFGYYLWDLRLDEREVPA